MIKLDSRKYLSDKRYQKIVKEHGTDLYLARPENVQGLKDKGYYNVIVGSQPVAIYHRDIINMVVLTKKVVKKAAKKKAENKTTVKSVKH